MQSADFWLILFDTQRDLWAMCARAIYMQCRSPRPSQCECNACTHALSFWMNNSRLNFICGASISTWRGIFIRSPLRYGDYMRESAAFSARAGPIVMTISSLSSPRCRGGWIMRPGRLADGRPPPPLGASEGSLFIIGGRQLPSITAKAHTQESACKEQRVSVCAARSSEFPGAAELGREHTAVEQKTHPLLGEVSAGGLND